MKRLLISSALSIAVALSASAQIADAKVKADFEKRKTEINDPELFKIFQTDLTSEERECLEMLYAYMALPDMTDNSGEFFKTNAQYALKARNEMPWGKKVPDLEFRHYVLPVRINNEALDMSRPVIYNELKDRIKNMSMKDAILEINHWLHEKATYQPSDSRTHAPLATMSSAIGRCGEESTFGVATYRAMGIPARQVYTPRWAHTDDNHAWVEVWADGKWYFLGACEPEPVLNKGWFNAPAARGMLMHARVFGDYNGSDIVLQKIGGHTDVNVTSNYAPVDDITVIVTDEKGKPVKGARVDFRIYNYAEFYPIASQITGENGKVSLSAGLGDVLIWASDGKKFAIKQATVGKGEPIKVKLENTKGTGTMEMHIIPPAPRNADVPVSKEMAAENSRRMAVEDSIRGAYVASFASNSPQSVEGVNDSILHKILVDARGNGWNLLNYLKSATPAQRDRIVTLLNTLTMKDRSDVDTSILASHLANSEGDDFEYVISPRVLVEALTPYREAFLKKFTKKQREEFKKNPKLWADWVRKNVRADQTWYPDNVTMSPAAVLAHPVTSAFSRDVFFVAGARSFGISSRIDPVTGKTQWREGNGPWNDVVFGNAVEEQKAQPGKLKLTFTPDSHVKDPLYYVNFSISKIVDGRPELLNFDEGNSWSNTFKDGIDFDPGNYMLVSGQRLADGSVLTNVSFFDVESGKETVTPLVMRHNTDEIEVIGSFNAESLFERLGSDKKQSLLSATGRGYYVLGLIAPNSEPTNHALRDIAAVKSELEQWGRPIVLLNADQAAADKMNLKALPALPNTVIRGIDPDDEIAKALIKEFDLSVDGRPIFIVADTFNRVVFVMQGYTIGLGHKLLNVVNRLQ